MAPEIPRILSIGSHAALGALNAHQNGVNPLLGILQAVAIEGAAHTPFANSLAGGAALAVTYGIFAADLAGLDNAFNDWLGVDRDGSTYSPPPTPGTGSGTGGWPIFGGGGRTG